MAGKRPSKGAREIDESDVMCREPVIVGGAQAFDAAGGGGFFPL